MSIHYIIGNLNVYSKSFFGLFHAFILKMNEFNENMVTACMKRVPSLRKNIRSYGSQMAPSISGWATESRMLQVE